MRKIEYVPLPSQARFHRSLARFKGFSGPIGSGKSQALCQEAIKLSYLNPGRTGLLGAPTYPMLRDATQSTLLDILNRNGIPYELNKGENVLIFWDTGSRILFRAVDEFERLRGTNLAWFGLDELTYTQEEAWVVLEGRLRDPEAKRLCGFGVWTPKGHDWVYRRFVAEPVEGYEVIIAAPFENRYLLARVPDFYERLKNSYDPKFYRQEVLGEYLDLCESRVYWAFRRTDHVRPCEARLDVPLLWALDFNVDPMCSLVAQSDGDTVWVLDEIVLSRGTTEQACEEFVARFPYHHAGAVVYGDAAGGYAKTTGTTDYQVIGECLRRAGYEGVRFRVPRLNPPVRERVLLVNAKLGTAGGDQKLYVSPRCRELIKDLEEVTYKPSTTVIDKERDPRRTHLSDALGYLLWQEFKGGRPVGERCERLL
ncbi:MAG: phage terminase large subunit [Bryobacteraceae bacterium]